MGIGLKTDQEMKEDERVSKNVIKYN